MTKVRLVNTRGTANIAICPIKTVFVLLKKNMLGQSGLFLPQEKFLLLKDLGESFGMIGKSGVVL